MINVTDMKGITDLYLSWVWRQASWRRRQQWLQGQVMIWRIGSSSVAVAWFLLLSRIKNIFQKLGDNTMRDMYQYLHIYIYTRSHELTVETLAKFTFRGSWKQIVLNLNCVPFEKMTFHPKYYYDWSLHSEHTGVFLTMYYQYNHLLEITTNFLRWILLTVFDRTVNWSLFSFDNPI